MDTLRARFGRDEGQTFVEYALILAAVVALAMGVIFTGLGAAIQNAITQVTNAFGA
jgi:Flp pilus assembly pilin Flp